MPSRQRDDTTLPEFQGFDRPEANWFRMPNNWTDITAGINNIAEMKVVEYILRHTWGFQEYGIKKRITVDEFMKGRKHQDGSRMDMGTGLSEMSVRNGIQKAIADGLIEEEIDDSDRGRIKKFYSLRMRNSDDLELGVQTLDPRVQSLGDRGASFRPRTEKETLERNFNSNSKAITKKDSEGNHKPNPESIGVQKPSQTQTVQQQAVTRGNNEVKTKEETYQRKSPASRSRNPRRNEEETGIVNNLSNPTANRGLSPLAASLPAYEPTPEIDFTQARQVIQVYITDFAKELNDKAPLRSSSTRALNLMKRSGLPLETFINRMYEARAITKESTGSIRTKSGADQYGIKSKMAYWFSVLEEVCGLAEEKD